MEDRQLELLLDIQRRLDEMEQREKKRDRRRRWRVVVLSLLIAALLAAGAYGVYRAVTEYNALMQQLAEVQAAVEEVVDQLDVKSITGTVNRLATMDVTGLENLLSYLAGKDKAELAKTIEDIKSAVDNVSKLDIDALNSSLDKISKTLAPLVKLLGAGQ